MCTPLPALHPLTSNVLAAKAGGPESTPIYNLGSSLLHDVKNGIRLSDEKMGHSICVQRD